MNNLTNYREKPEWYESDKIRVKFRDDFRIRLRDGVLVDTDLGKELSLPDTLNEQIKDGVWLRGHGVGEDRLEQFRKDGSAVSEKPLPDLNNYYVLFLPGKDALALIEQFEKLKEVEFSAPILKPVPPPAAPDFTAANATGRRQGYLRSAINNGVNAFFAWNVPGGDGAGVSICDVEYDWLVDHVEFQSNGGLQIVGDPPLNPLGVSVRDHGTNVVGEYGSADDSNGTKGISFNARKLAATVVPARLIPFYDIANAITTAMNAMQPGDIILIEQHIPGPRTDHFDNQEQDGFLPVEWDKTNYDAIITAVANGIIVVEAAGNGAQDLDDAIYRQGNHHPFVRGNSSGAIMVGAGNSRDRSRLGFSNFGSRVDVQGWGNGVVTTASDPATADLWSSDGPDQLYTFSFGGTSSASPIVAGCCACIQGVFINLFSRPASPEEMLQLLLMTNSIQGGDISQKIGPLPNLQLVITFLQSLFPKPPLIEPVSNVYPIPLQVSINPFYGGLRGDDFQTWYTLDGSDPVERAPNSISLDYFDSVFTIDQPGNTTVKARTFYTNEFTGERIASPIAQTNYRGYVPGLGPRNLRASRNRADSITIRWDRLPGAVGYDVYAGVTRPLVRLNRRSLRTNLYFDRSDAGTGLEKSYWVRATLMNGQVTQFSGPVIGRYGVYSLTVEASDNQFPDHVLVSWSYPLWNPRSWEIVYAVYRGVTSDFNQAAEIYRVLPRTRTVVVGNRTVQLPDGIDQEIQDFTAARGVVYYYWVRAFEINGARQTPSGSGDAGSIY